MKPEERIRAYLYTIKSKIQYSSLDVVVQDVKLSVFYGMSPISEDEIRKIVSQWAVVNAVGLLITSPTVSSPPKPPANTPPTSDSELVDAVKKAISTINNGVTLGKKGANINLGVSGFTANLKKNDSSASLGLSWTGTLQLQAESGPFHFSGSLASDKWEITLSFPQDTYIPDISTLGKVFTAGEKAIGNMADATKSFHNIADASKVGALIKPHAAALKDAVEAASGIAGASKQGGVSFGFKLGSPDPMPGEQGMPKGVQGAFVLTYVF